MGSRQKYDPSLGQFYVAKKPLQVNKDDVRQVGAALPEAFNWGGKTRSLESTGRIVFVPIAPPKPPEQPKLPDPPKPAPEPKAEVKVEPKPEPKPEPKEDPGPGAAKGADPSSPPSVTDGSKSGAAPKQATAPAKSKPKP